MICQLIKRDLAWQAAVQIACLIALLFAAGVLYHRFGALGNMGWGMVLIMMWLVYAPLMGMGSSEIQKRCTPFEAALPLDGRQIFYARMISAFALLWLPTLVLVAGVAAFKTADAAWAIPNFIQTVAIYTVAVAISRSVGIQELNSPAWASRLAAGCALLIAGVAWFAQWGHSAWGWPEWSLSPWMVIAGCGLVTAAVLLRAWGRIPRSFQIVTEIAAREARGETRGRSSPGMAYAPVLRAVLGQGFSLCIAALWVFHPIFSVIWLAGYLLRVFSHLEWMRPLPVSRHKLFAVAQISVWAVLVLATWGFLSLVRLAHRAEAQGLRPALIVAGAMIALALSATLTAQLLTTCRQQSSEWLRALLAAAILLGWSLATWYFELFNIRRLTVRLSHLLPQATLPLVLLVAAVLGTLYYLADRQFCKREMSLLLAKTPRAFGLTSINDEAGQA